MEAEALAREWLAERAMLLRACPTDEVDALHAAVEACNEKVIQAERTKNMHELARKGVTFMRF